MKLMEMGLLTASPWINSWKQMAVDESREWWLNFWSVEVVLDEDEEADFALTILKISSNGTSWSQANTCCHSIAPMTRATLDKLTSSSRAVQRIVFLHVNEGSGWPRWISTFVGLKRNAKHIKNKTTWDNWEKHEKHWRQVHPTIQTHSTLISKKRLKFFSRFIIFFSCVSPLNQWFSL